MWGIVATRIAGVTGLGAWFVAMTLSSLGSVSAQGTFGQSTQASSGLSSGSTMSTSGFSGSAGSSFSGGTGSASGVSGFGSSAGSGAQSGMSSSQPNGAQFAQQQGAQQQFIGGGGNTLESFLSGQGQVSRSAQDTNLRSENQRRFQSEQPTNTKIPIRTHLNIRFPRTQLAPAAVTSQVQKNLALLPANKSIASARSNLTAVVEGRTVTLRGRVASEDERRLAVRLARIEPGVSTVVDELQVAP